MAGCRLTPGAYGELTTSAALRTARGDPAHRYSRVGGWLVDWSHLPAAVRRCSSVNPVDTLRKRHPGPSDHSYLWDLCPAAVLSRSTW